MYVDSHCHLDFPELSDRLPEVLANMAAAEVEHALCISVTLEDWPRVAALAGAHPQLSASVGVHPDNTGVREPSVEELVALSRTNKIVAIGETGLDYYRATGDLSWQRERFRNHIRAARECGKPLIIHTRAAAEDTLRIMREEGAGEVGGVMHCFTENWETAQAALELGFHISISGIVTFRNAAVVRDVAARVPDERLLIETDSPYLAPVPFRGKTNEPARVIHVAATVAELRAAPVEAVAATTTANFYRLFGAGHASVGTDAREWSPKSH
ncbi:MAG TPA: TatD family hydrolase [Lautropia sp.]|jgi:TatD DNase family protein|nr:TatD family hydrolase [Lautropia sp.]